MRSDSSPAEATSPRIVSISGRPGGRERPEGQYEDRERHGPGEELGLHHRRPVRDVEVAPHPGGAGQRDVDPRRARIVQRTLQPVGGRDHRRRIALRSGRDQSRVPVGRDRRPGARRHDRPDRGVGGEQAADARDARAKRRVGDGRGRRVHDDGQGRAGEAGEVLLDQPARLHRLRAVRLPARARERRLHARREHPQADRDERPADRHEPDVVGHEAPETSDRPHRLGMLERARVARPGGPFGEGAHRCATRAVNASACRCSDPHTTSQSSSTLVSVIR